MRPASLAFAILPVLAAASARARAGDCLDQTDATIAVGVSSHYVSGQRDQSDGFAVDAGAFAIALRERVACHVAIGARLASESELDLHILGDMSPPDGISDLTPELTIGANHGRLRAQLSVGPALYSATPDAQGIGLGADALLGAAVSSRLFLGGEAVTTIDRDRTALSYLVVLGGAIAP